MPITHARKWKTPLLVGLVNVAIGLMALILNRCLSPSALAITLVLCVMGILSIWGRKEKFTGILTWAALGSLVVTGYSFFGGCVTQWHEFRGETVPYIVVSNIVSQPWVGAAYACLGGIVGGLLYWTFWKIKEIGHRADL